MGTGDPAGVTIPHTVTSGMGGLRTAGDLVARMQMTRGMKLAEAKKYAADKLGISTTELIDEVVMREVREDHKIGFITSRGGIPKGSKPNTTLQDCSISTSIRSTDSSSGAGDKRQPQP